MALFNDMNDLFGETWDAQQEGGDGMGGFVAKINPVGVDQFRQAIGDYGQQPSRSPYMPPGSTETFGTVPGLGGGPTANPYLPPSPAAGEDIIPWDVNGKPGPPAPPQHQDHEYPAGIRGAVSNVWQGQKLPEGWTSSAGPIDAPVLRGPDGLSYGPGTKLGWDDLPQDLFGENSGFTRPSNLFWDPFWGGNLSGAGGEGRPVAPPRYSGIDQFLGWRK